MNNKNIIQIKNLIDKTSNDLFKYSHKYIKNIYKKNENIDHIIWKSLTYNDFYITFNCVTTINNIYTIKIKLKHDYRFDNNIIY